MDFIKLTEKTLPEPNTLLWCRRKGGAVYLATRTSNPISKNDEEPWANCQWYGFPEAGEYFRTDGRNMENVTNFSDVSVDGYSYVTKPS